MVYKIQNSETKMEHSGILGMKWGIRRYQNEDGTYTSLGKARLRQSRKYEDDLNKYSNDDLRRMTTRLTKENAYANANRTSAERGYDHLETAAKVSNTAAKTAKTIAKLVGASGAEAAFDIADNATSAFAKSIKISKDRSAIRSRIKSMAFAKTLSDEELGTLVDRLNLENAYRNASNQAYKNGKFTVTEMVNMASDAAGVATDVSNVKKGIDKIQNSNKSNNLNVATTKVNNLDSATTKKGQAVVNDMVIDGDKIINNSSPEVQNWIKKRS